MVLTLGLSISPPTLADIVIPDESGNGQDATFTGDPMFLPACAGQALYIDGLAERGSVPASASQILQTLTVEGFFTWDGNTNEPSLGRGIIEKVEQSGDAGRNWAIGIIKATRQLTAVVWYDAENGRLDLLDPDPLPDPMTQCVHVALTVAAGGEVRLYRDGQLKASAPFDTLSINYAINSPIGFGNSSNLTSPLSGSLDNFRISNIVRTSFPSDPEKLSVDANTVALWRFGADCPPYSVSGYVRDGQGIGIPGVQVVKGCDVGGFTLTDADGYWVVNGITDPTCIFTPVLGSLTFSPPSRTVSGCAVNADFTGCTESPPYSVSGYVRDSQGVGLAGVTVNKGCDQQGWTTTDAEGYWIVANITDGTCVFTPQLAGCTFSPPHRTISGCARDIDFRCTDGVTDVASTGAAPRSAFLNAPSPDPFVDRTKIRFGVPSDASARVEVFDVTGRSVAVLLDRRLGAGYHEVEWAPAGTDQPRLASGVYFCRLTVDKQQAIRRMTFLK